MAESRIIVEHLSGARRGTRHEFATDATVRFGRHPDNEVPFHAHRDIDASSRHAELCVRDGRHVLRDVGSSNGTFVDGERVVEHVLEMGASHIVDFGMDGPKVRVYLGDPETIPPVPVPIDVDRDITHRYLMAVAVLMILIVSLAVVAWMALV